MNIRFLHKRNGGIHTAQNMAITHASGAYITRIDSDDMIISNALKEKDRYLNAIPKDIESKVIGVVGLCLNKSDGSIRGTNLPQDLIITTGRELRKMGVSGDKNYCMKTSVMRDYLLPEHTDTKWVPEGNALWVPIDKKYLTCFVNTPFSVCSEPSPLSMMGAVRVKSPGTCMSFYYSSMYYIKNDDSAGIISISKAIIMMWYNAMFYNGKSLGQVLKDTGKYKVLAMLLYIPVRLSFRGYNYFRFGRK